MRPHWEGFSKLIGEREERNCFRVVWAGIGCCFLLRLENGRRAHTHTGTPTVGQLDQRIWAAARAFERVGSSDHANTIAHATPRKKD